MKIHSIKNGFFFFSVLCLFTSNVIATEPTEPSRETAGNDAQKPKFVSEFETPTEFMEAFVDVSKKPEKSFIWWAYQLIVLCQKDPRLKKFSALLAKAAKGNPDEPKINRAKVASELFIQYQMLFSQELQHYILHKAGLQKVFAAMKKRAEK
jgi:hypothetical protein